MVEECSELIQELLEARGPSGGHLLGAGLRERAQLGLALLEEAREEGAAHQKYASLGRLAAAVLHELLNPLAFVQTNLDVLAADLPALLAGDTGRDPAWADDTKVLVEESRVGVERISAALSALRILLREDTQGARGNVHRAGTAAARLIGMRLPTKVTLEQDFAEVPDVACGDGLVGQVLLHLLLRSLDAVGDEGRIALRIRPGSAGDVVIEIEHGGGAVTEPQQQLGFSLAQHLVERAGGQLERIATATPGARYLVRLPAAVDAH